jgi:hypothetical protein
MMVIGTDLARLEEGFGGKTNDTMLTDPEQKIAG